MKKSFIFFFIILNSNYGFTQLIDSLTKFEKYDKLIFKAKINYVDKEYKNSFQNYTEALKIIPNDLPDIYFYAAVAAFYLNKYEEAKKLIIESIKQTNTSKNYFLRFNDFDPFRSNKIFKEIEADYSKYQKYFILNLKNPEIYEEMNRMIESDQAIRNTGGGFDETDTKNINRLIEITKKYGWQEEGWLILWHQRGTYGDNKHVWSFFKPYIDNCISKGTIRKSFWAMFDEQASIFANQTQIYGLFWSQLDEYPIKDIENVDKRLKEAGLPPLWYMRKTLGVKLPEDYKGTSENSPL